MSTPNGKRGFFWTEWTGGGEQWQRISATAEECPWIDAEFLAAEADLFRHLIRRQVIQRLAETYPTPRKKEEVPLWIYLSSELTLKLHGAQSYHAFPRILRCGGLIEALGPEMGGRKTPHPETGDVTLACPGFNHKNDYDRQTPCDQDFLRKFAHDTNTDRLHAWFNREVPRCLRSLGLFDPEGLFIGDASYLFATPPDDHCMNSFMYALSCSSWRSVVSPIT